jgi:spermidine synthase
MIAFTEDFDLAIHFRNLELVEAPDSPVQEIRLLRHPQLGYLLTINGELQHAQAWQALYHEPLVHVPTSFLREVRDVLILGGGSLFAAAEALKYPSLRQCILVDHDRTVLDLMARYYDHARQVLADRRFTWVEGDALAFVRRCGDQFDLIVNDCLDLLATEPRPGSPFRLLADRLTEDGVCADLIYRHLWEQTHLQRTRQHLAEFANRAVSMVVVPEYPGVLHALVMWGTAAIAQDASKPRNRVQMGWVEAGRSPCQFYDPRFLAFHLYLSPLLAGAWR